MPELRANLLNVSKLVEKGNRVVFDQNFKCLSAENSKNGLVKWHRGSGHMSYESLIKMTIFVNNINIKRDDKLKEKKGNAKFAAEKS